MYGPSSPIELKYGSNSSLRPGTKLVKIRHHGSRNELRIGDKWQSFEGDGVIAHLHVQRASCPPRINAKLSLSPFFKFALVP